MQIGSRFSGARQEKPDEANCGALERLEEISEQWRSRLPQDHEALWDWLIEQPQPVLLQLLGYLTATATNAWQQRHANSKSRIHNVNQIANAVSLDMRKWWQPSSGFFQRVPKSVAIAAMRETDARPEVISGVEKDSKADAVATALDHLAQTGWLPAPLRTVETPAYVMASDEPETEEDSEELPEATE